MNSHLIHAAKVALLAIVYILSGKLGLLLAVPPGYATVIWPPSGIALGALLLNGWRLWPGILIGSFFLNCSISGALSPDTGLDTAKTLAAAAIAAGSTLQALAGRLLISRLIGIPLVLNNLRDIFKLFFLGGPATCLIAATIGTASLYAFGFIPEIKIADNWSTWWLGDMFGIIVFLPLMLIAPGNTYQTTLYGNKLGSLPVLAMLTILVPLGLTFYAWKIAAENSYQSSLAEFNMLTIESEHALLHRINTYNYALLGGAGFIQGSDFVSREEWREYVNRIDVKRNFPGVHGVGLIFSVANTDIESFLSATRKDGSPAFKIHPEVTDLPHYIITYIEPSEDNQPAIGLNIAFEKNRRDAAELARDTGQSVITKRIALVQDAGHTPGFLLLHPIYKPDMPIRNIEDRREALRGWIYAPFIAQNFFHDLTRSQKDDLRFEVYDGKEPSPDRLIFEDDKDQTDPGSAPAAFSIKKTVKIMQQDWTLSWDSTPAFENKHRSKSSFLILAGGLLFTGLFSLFLMIATVKNTETLEHITEKRQMVLPILIFIATSIGAFSIYSTLRLQETNFIKSMAKEEANKVEQLITVSAADKILALKRMAQRWETAKRTPPEEWEADAKNYIRHIPGLKSIEWIDASYTVRKAEPRPDTDRINWIDFISKKGFGDILQQAAQKHILTITPPVDLPQGQKAFIALAPLKVDGKLDGFIAGTFAMEDFFNNTFADELSDKYAVTLEHDGKNLYKDEHNKDLLDQDLKISNQIRIHNMEITANVIPTKKFIETQQSVVPIMVFFGGLLIAVLLSLTMRYVMISRIKSHYLKASEETFRTAMEHASIGMALLNLEGKWLTVNQALCDLLGYSEEEFLRTDFSAISHPDDTEHDRKFTKSMLQKEIKSYQLERRCYHKRGDTIWTLMSASLAHHPDGRAKYFIVQVQDISGRKEIDRIKSEFISVVSHELRTPLTSIRGSLGLIQGTMLKELPEKAGSLISLAIKNTERLILLINDILDIDKIASGQMEFDMKPEDLSALIKQGLETNQGYAEKFGIRFIADPLPQNIIVYVDAARWQQVFSNLLSNAAKFSPEGRDVKISINLDEEKVRLSVQDYGPGIPEEFHSRIFGRFSQANSATTRSKGGSGLGLHISKELTEAMGGAIGFETEVGKGTIFWIDLPYKKLVGPEGLEPPTKPL